MNTEMLLSSAVIAAILSGIISFFISRRQETLQYITGERKEWREKIREIAYNLNGANYKDTLKLLTELKVRINAFGNREVLVSYSSDAHIWDLINEIEKEEPKRNILKLMQKQLIEYLSLLLKVDWERSKKEVRGDIYNTISLLLLLASEIFFIVSIFCLHIEDLKVFHLISVSIEFFLLMLFMYFFLKIETKGICKIYLNGVYKVELREYKKKKLYISYVLWGISIFIMALVYVVFINDFLNLVSCGENNPLIILITFVIYFCGLILMGWIQVSDVDKIYYYNEGISKIKFHYEQDKFNNCNNKK